MSVSSDQKWECYASKQVDENSLSRGALLRQQSQLPRRWQRHRGEEGAAEGGEKQGDKKLFSVKRHRRYSGGRAHMRHHDNHFASA